MGDPLALSGMAAALLEAAPDAVLVVDSNGSIRLVNHAAESLFGYPRDEMVGQSIELLVPDADRGAHVAARSRYQTSPSRRPMGDYQVRARRRDGTCPWIAVSLSPAVVDDQHLVVAIARDVSERRAMEERLRYLGTHDALSGLANRAYFDEEVARLGRGRHGPISAIVADLDGLKRVNDELGHAAGDRLIRQAGETFRAAFRAEDLVARLGGDELGVLLPGVDESRLAESMGRARARLDEARISMSLGGATAEVPSGLPEALRLADRRMYEDKASRRTRSRTDSRVRS